MERSEINYQNCVKILEEELLPAMGCTEPIALAYAGAVARKTLNKLPDRVEIEASGNIIKNVKSVIVPNTGKLKGIPAAAAAGIVAGNPDKQLEVIADVTEQQQQLIHDFLEQTAIDVRVADSPYVFDIILTVHCGEEYAKVRICQYHTNIVLIEKNRTILYSQELKQEAENLTDRRFLTVELILDFANSVAVEDIRTCIGRQIEYNMAIAEEGLKNSYGANVGSTLLKSNENSVKTTAKSWAAAGSDARMNGCEMPVVINSGSGNQGITASVPVIIYARHLQVSEEKLYRALVLSNLIAIHQKTGIGRLSAYCGAVNAGAAAGCGIAYLLGGGYEAIKHTLVNALAIVSGMICDGAKASCAAKIATAVESGIFGYEMYCNGQQFYGGDGIVKNGVEQSISSVGQLGREGMRETDRVILNIMVND